jgi:hypothetical protein
MGDSDVGSEGIEPIVQEGDPVRAEVRIVDVPSVAASALLDQLQSGMGAKPMGRSCRVDIGP